MKKFLDFTSDKKISLEARDPFFIPIAAKHKHELTCKKYFEKIEQGLKSKHLPYVYFFNSSSEAFCALAHHIFLSETTQTGKNHFLFEATAAHGILDFAKKAKKWQIYSHLIPVTTEGKIDLEALKEKIGPKVQFFSQRLVHPVLGTINDEPNQISDLLQKNSIFYHLDVTEAFGEKFWDFETLCADFISFDLASLAAGFEGAVIFSKKELTDLLPHAKFVGAEFLEKFVTALEEFYDHSSSKMLKMISAKMHLVQKLKEKIPQVEIVIPTLNQSISRLLIHLPNVHQEMINFMLLSNRMCVELGGGAEITIDSLVELLGYDAKYAQSTLSLSLSPDLTSHEIDEFVEALFSAYQTLLMGAI
jgi:cysteine sulfinate desulfinase/cysteine desulfurase-like protein